MRLPTWVMGVEIDLPDGVHAMLAVAGYKADYLPPKYVNGARIKGTGGFQIIDENGACMAHLPLGATFEDWQRALGTVLDYKEALRTSMSEAFSATSSVFGPQ